MYLNSTNINVRSDPYVPQNGSDNRIGMVKERGTALKVTGKTTYNGKLWYRVEFEGKTGFLFGQYLDAEEPKVSGGSGIDAYQLFREARKYINLRYSSNVSLDLKVGTDCAGFTMLLMRKFGIELPRGTSEQIDYCKENAKAVSWSEARPGDIVLTSRDPYSHGGHSGIFLGEVDGVYYYLSQSGNYSVHIGRLQGAYLKAYQAYRVYDFSCSKSPKEIYREWKDLQDSMRSAGTLRKNIVNEF